ncbi:MAG: antibiotic biosynthesis monooxygenase [Pseudomonadales bacterium]|nr:antibiotic biosynthesis monooxygenase [Pseudomonadales bacterium]
MIIVWGSMTAKANQLDALLKISLEHVHRSRNELGCVSHSVQIDAENTNRIVFYEEWMDMNALQTHFKVSESRLFVKDAKVLSEADGFDMKMYEATLL